jgi:signal transduction histidine kinase
MIYTLIYHRERRDFSEFMLHHILTCALISYSYTFNFLPYGAIIMLIHDASDIFVSAFRACLDVAGLSTFAPVYFMMIFTWIYFRLYYFPFKLITNLYEQYTTTNNKK